MRQGCSKDATNLLQVCHKPTPSLRQANAKPTPATKQAHNNTETATQQLQSSQGCGLRTSGRRAIRLRQGRGKVGELPLGASLVPRSACPCGRGKVAARSAIIRHFFGLFFLGSFLARKRFFLGCLRSGVVLVSSGVGRGCRVVGLRPPRGPSLAHFGLRHARAPEPPATLTQQTNN